MDFQNRMHAGKIGRTKFLVPELQSNLEHLGEMRNWFDELMAVNQVADQWSETTDNPAKVNFAIKSEFIRFGNAPQRHRTAKDKKTCPSRQCCSPDHNSRRIRQSERKFVNV